MNKFKYILPNLFITITLLFLSKVKSDRIIHLNENLTELRSNLTGSITNNELPYFTYAIGNDTFNNTQDSIIKAFIGFDNFIFDIAKNITTGMRFAQYFILNKTKTFIFPFIMFPDEKSFDNFKNLTSNSTETDGSKLLNFFPVNFNFVNPGKSNFTNSTLESNIIRPELFIPYLRGSSKMIKQNETKIEITKNFTDMSPRNDSEKIINSTMIRLNKFSMVPGNSSLNSTGKTAAPRFLQFTIAYGLDGINNQYFGPISNNFAGIPDVGGYPTVIPEFDNWDNYNGFGNENSYGIDFLFME